MAETSENKIKKGFVAGTGRRKTSVARVFLWEEKGDFEVNGKNINDYFPSEKEQIAWAKPFHIIGISHPEAKFTASIKVQGSGKSGQLEAVVHGLSWALANLKEDYAETLRSHNMLTRDPRMVERKKPFLRKARKRPQYSKR